MLGSSKKLELEGEINLESNMDLDDNLDLDDEINLDLDALLLSYRLLAWGNR